MSEDEDGVCNTCEVKNAWPTLQEYEGKAFSDPNGFKFKDNICTGCDNGYKYVDGPTRACTTCETAGEGADGADFRYNNQYHFMDDKVKIINSLGHPPAQNQCDQVADPASLGGYGCPQDACSLPREGSSKIKNFIDKKGKPYHKDLTCCLDVGEKAVRDLGAPIEEPLVMPFELYQLDGGYFLKVCDTGQKVSSYSAISGATCTACNDLSPEDACVPGCYDNADAKGGENNPNKFVNSRSCPCPIGCVKDEYGERHLNHCSNHACVQTGWTLKPDKEFTVCAPTGCTDQECCTPASSESAPSETPCSGNTASNANCFCSIADGGGDGTKYACCDKDIDKWCNISDGLWCQAPSRNTMLAQRYDVTRGIITSDVCLPF